MVISNTTPLINFAETGLPNILEDLFSKVSIPETVALELQAKSSLFPLAAQVPNLDFIEITGPVDHGPSKELGRSLHPGEADCLALSMETAGSKLILDDVAARQVANFHGLEYTGTLGCLLEAKQRGLLREIQPVLDELRTKARFWLHPNLHREVMKLAGELQ